MAPKTPGPGRLAVPLLEVPYRHLPGGRLDPSLAGVAGLTGRRGSV